jgi:hypothetical protein
MLLMYGLYMARTCILINVMVSSLDFFFQTTPAQCENGKTGFMTFDV